MFQRNLDAYAVGQYASWTAWTAPSSMKAADAAKRVGMSEADLRSVNGIPPHMIIKAGSTLIVPRSAKMEQDVAPHLAENGQLALQAEVVTRRTTVKAGKNESVASIAKRYKLPPANVAEWNSVAATASFAVGHQVVLFLPVRMKSAGPARGNSRAVKRPPQRKKK